MVYNSLNFHFQGNFPKNWPQRTCLLQYYPAPHRLCYLLYEQETDDSGCGPQSKPS